VLFGSLHTRTGSLVPGYALLIASATASGILMLLIPGMRRRTLDGTVSNSSQSVET
jgi:hypothetical protein